MIRTLLFTLGLAILTGCGATVPLGSGESTGGSGNSPSTGGASSALSTGGSSSVQNTGAYVCSSLDGAPATISFDTAQMGDHCDDNDACGPGGCGTGGPSLFGTSPTTHAMACVNHRVHIVTSAPIDWSANVATADAGTAWTDCNSALTQGKSGDSCTWVGGECTRPTDDPCCIEIAVCEWRPAENGRPAYGTVRGTRACAPGCQNVTPDTTQATVTDCVAAVAQNICRFATPCEAGLACTGYPGTGKPITDPSVDPSIMVTWCANGVLVGGYFNGITDVQYY